MKKKIATTGAPTLFEDANAKWLDLARRQAKIIALNDGTVCADDVNKLVPFTGVSRNVIGALFKDPAFVSCGFMKSNKPSRKGAIITIWKLRPEVSIKM